MTKKEVIKRKKVAIVGTADHWKDAPFNDPDCEIWILNGLYATGCRFDRFFDLHNKEVASKVYNDLNPKNNYEQFLVDNQYKVTLQKELDIAPNINIYPLEEITNKYGRYLTNTVSYLLALALHEGYQDILLYGVDMADSTEYAEQRPSCEYFLGIIQGMINSGADMTLYIHEQSSLLKSCYLYGFESPPAFIEDQRKKKANYNMQLNEIRKQQASHSKALNELAQKECALLFGIDITNSNIRQWS